MNKILLNLINSELEDGEFGVLCTVTEESGSTPRSKGASMWVRRDGSISGTIGGGLIEFEAIKKAKELLASGETVMVWKKNLTEKDGMLCGGTATVYMEVLGREDELLIFGAGHVGKAVAQAAALVGFRVTVWDEREEYANRENIPWARTVVCPIEEIFEKRRHGHLLHGDYSYDPTDDNDSLNNRESLSDILKQLDCYHLYQQQAYGGILLVLAKSYCLVEHKNEG